MTPSLHIDLSPAAPGFWTLLGQGIVAGAQRVGAGMSAAFHAVDPDARHDIAQLPLLALTVLGPRHAPIAPLPDDGHRTLLFIHGLGGHRGNFLPMRLWLGLRGRRRGYSIGLPPGDDLQHLGRWLCALIDEIVQVNDLPDDAQVDIIAHSMGGVVARLAALEVHTAQRISTLITLGTPHAGTGAARFAATARCRDLRQGSAVMQRLAAQVPWSGHPRLICFWSASDPMMQPERTAQVPGADNRHLRGHSHTDYLLKPTAFAAVLDALEGR